MARLLAPTRTERYRILTLHSYGPSQPFATTHIYADKVGQSCLSDRSDRRLDARGARVIRRTNVSWTRESETTSAGRLNGSDVTGAKYTKQVSYCVT